MVNGWVEKSLDDLFYFSGGLSASRMQLSNKGYPYLHYGDIHGTNKTYVDVCTDGAIPRFDVDINKVSNASLLKDGDVVFVDASEDDEGASRHIVVRNAENIPFISGLHTIIAKAKTDELDSGYKEFCFQTEAVKSQFKFYAVGTKVMGLNKATISKINLLYPKSKSEQRRIAAVLSDTDKLITALEKLTAKKRAIKQGAMQELLTGKRRLPGFGGEWVERKLGEVLKLQGGYSFDSLEFIDYGIPVIRISDITGTDVNIFESVCVNNPNIPIQFIANYGDILIAMSGATTGKLGRYTYKQKAYINQRVGKFDIYDRTENNADFLFYIVQTDSFVTQLEKSLAQGAQPNISGKQIEDFVFIFSSDYAEQSAIASILSDMDAEIDALTAKLNKYKRVKQGMMSELLTGRIRLLEDGEEVTPK